MNSSKTNTSGHLFGSLHPRQIDATREVIKNRGNAIKTKKKKFEKLVFIYYGGARDGGAYPETRIAFLVAIRKAGVHTDSTYAEEEQKEGHGVEA